MPCSGTPFASVRLFLSHDPRLLPGQPLYNVLALPEAWGDNSPGALIDRLFDERFQTQSVQLVPDFMQLHSICEWIIGYMHFWQGAADRALEAIDEFGHIHPHAWPMKNPQAYAWSLFTYKVGLRHPGDASASAKYSGSSSLPAQVAHQPQPTVVRMPRELGVPGQAYRPPHLRRKDEDHQRASPASQAEAWRRDPGSPESSVSSTDTDRLSNKNDFPALSDGSASTGSDSVPASPSQINQEGEEECIAVPRRELEQLLLALCSRMTKEA